MSHIVGIHNLSLRKLRFAQAIGGLPCPSIAYVRSDTPMQEFGDITLVADPPLANPAQTKLNVFDADIYSSRFPDLTWEMDSAALVRILEPTQEIADRIGTLTSMETKLQDLISRKGTEGLYFESEDTLEMRLHYLESEHGRMFPEDELPRKSLDLGALSSESQDLREYLQSIKDFGVNRDAATDEMHALVTKAFDQTVSVLAEATAETPTSDAIEEEKTYWRNALYSDYFTPQGKLSLIGIERLSKDQSQLKVETPSVDRNALSETIRTIFKDTKSIEHYREWIDQTFKPAINRVSFLEPYGNQGKQRRKEATLENIVRFMNRQTQNGEDFMYGAGNIRAQVATGFRSWAKMTGQVGRIVSEEAFDAHRKHLNQRLIALTDTLRPHYKFSQSHFDGQALANILSEPGAASGSWMNDFKNLDQEHKAEVEGYLSELKTAPTTYFEGKFRRAVGLGEFSQALVPASVIDKSPQIVSELESEGLVVTPYANAGHYRALMKSAGKQYGKAIGPDIRPSPGANLEP